MNAVIVVGGGLAGLFTAITLQGAGHPVVLLERKSYPFHRVCGEYVSREVLPLLEAAGIDPFAHGAKAIRRMTLSAPSGRSISAPLPLGAFSMSRYTLDALLARHAQAMGVDLRCGATVQSIRFEDDRFEVSLPGEHLEARVVIGAFGKRSHLDRKMGRPFFGRPSPYLAVKYHREGDFPEDLVALHNFQAGYCGVSRVENDLLNVCYLTTRDQLKRYGSIPVLEAEVLGKNPHLKRVFADTRSVFDQPLVINEISFAPKAQVVNHVLMAGDAAGLITPLCGNGMAMALHSAYLAAGTAGRFLAGTYSRREMETAYQRQWHRHFGRRLHAGRLIQRSFRARGVSELSLQFLQTFPKSVPFIIRQTHGKPVQVFSYT